MRLLPCWVLIAVPSLGIAQEIRVRRVEVPPPTSFGELLKRRGPEPSGPCSLPDPVRDSAGWTPLALADSVSARLRTGWARVPGLPGDDEYSETRLGGPDNAHVRIRRERGQASGRHYLMYQGGTVPKGRTCTVDRDAAGAIWTFYAPDPDVPVSTRPFGTFADLITPAGSWYSLTIWTPSAEAAARAAGAITEAMLGTSAPAQDARDQFFATLKALCGARFEGAKTFPADSTDSFTGKLLVATFASCTDTEIRVPFLVGEDRSRTWLFTRTLGGLQLQHDHRHADGTPDSVTMYGGMARAPGLPLAQSFAADAYTARLIPAAVTNVWTVSLSADRTTLTYHLERDGRPRFTAVLRRVQP